MKGYKTNIEKATLENENFRRVMYTSHHFQLVLMSLLPGEEIGMETHPGNDQFFRVEQGHGECYIDDRKYELSANDIVVIPAGARHNIINTDNMTTLKMYTIYAPPNHKDGTIHQTRQEALASKEIFDGVTSE